MIRPRDRARRATSNRTFALATPFALLASAIVPTLVLGATPRPTDPPAAAVSGGNGVSLVPVVPLPDDGARARALGWSLLIAGATFGVLGGTTVLVSQLSIDEREPEDRDGLTGWRGVRAAGFVGAGVGVVLATAGVFRLWTAPSAPRSSAAAPQVHLRASLGFVGLAGHF